MSYVERIGRSYGVLFWFTCAVLGTVLGLLSYAVIMDKPGLDYTICMQQDEETIVCATGKIDELREAIEFTRGTKVHEGLSKPDQSRHLRKGRKWMVEQGYEYPGIPDSGWGAEGIPKEFTHF